MQTLLIATLGTKDLQIVIEKDGEVFRIEVPKEDIYETHKYLSENIENIECWNGGFMPELLTKQKVTIDGTILSVSGVSIDPSKTKIKVFPGLLMEGLDLFKEKYRSFPDAVILFNTDRKKQGEPFASGGIVSRWISSYICVENAGEISAENIPRKQFCGFFNFLKGNDEITQWPSNQNNSVFSQIENMFAALSNLFKFERVLISTAGGIPQANEVIKAATGYYFRKSLISEMARDELKKKTEISNYNTTISVQKLLEIKKNAEILIESGDFHGAFAASSVWYSYSGKKKYPEWIRQLDYLQQFLSGSDIDENAAFALKELSMLSPASYIAINIDNELNQNQPYRALALTAAFMDSLLIEFVKMVKGFEVDVLKRAIKVEKHVKIPEVLTTFRNSVYYCMTKGDVPGTYFYRNDRGDFEYWIEGLKKLLPEKIQGLDVLTEIFNVVSKGEDFPSIIKDLSRNNPYGIRNLYNHYGILNMRPEKAIEIRKYMTSKKMWDTDSANPFLDAPLVSSIMNEIGSANAKQLFINVVLKIKGMMKNPE
ncbi:MAG TPA: hypothetical protein PLB16_07245 [bacterium]|nr:hypothetical protein [bacterium]